MYLLPRGYRPLRVVLHTPLLNRHLRLLQRIKYFSTDNIQNRRMADKLKDTLASITAVQKTFCEQHLASFVASPPGSKLGFALTTKGKLPINGLRHPIADDTNGWYIFPQRGTAGTFRSPRPNVGNIRASGEESLESFRQASMTGRTEFN